MGKDEAAWRCINDDCDKKEKFGNKAYFNKLLGEVEITEVFKIEMLRERSEDSTSGFINHLTYDLTNIHLPFPASETLAKRDGFKSSKEMFEIIDKMYDLASPKTFWVYRWKWL